MIKLFQSFSLLVLLLSLALSGCKTQPPTQLGVETGWGPDIIPSLVEGDFGLDPRDSGTIDTAAGMYNGRPMVRDLLGDVFFGFDSYSVSSTERAKLRAAADYLKGNPGDGLLIEGHCDWHGTADYNLALGDRRAKSVRDYLTTLGVSASRIETLSKGSLDSTPGLSKSEARQDRRGELIVLQ